jgi:hypothetical protein
MTRQLEEKRKAANFEVDAKSLDLALLSFKPGLDKNKRLFLQQQTAFYTKQYGTEYDPVEDLTSEVAARGYQTLTSFHPAGQKPSTAQIPTRRFKNTQTDEKEPSVKFQLNEPTADQRAKLDALLIKTDERAQSAAPNARRRNDIGFSQT